MVTENADFWRKIVVSGAWHPRRSETRVNYRGSSHIYVIVNDSFKRKKGVKKLLPGAWPRQPLGR